MSLTWRDTTERLTALSLVDIRVVETLCRERQLTDFIKLGGWSLKETVRILGPLLLTWFNFYPGMDK